MANFANLGNVANVGNVDNGRLAMSAHPIGRTAWQRLKGNGGYRLPKE